MAEVVDGGGQVLADALGDSGGERRLRGAAALKDERDGGEIEASEMRPEHQARPLAVTRNGEVELPADAPEVLLRAQEGEVQVLVGAQRPFGQHGADAGRDVRGR